MLVESSFVNDVQVIKFQNPPINALSVGNGFVEALTNAVKEATDNESVQAVVLHGGRRFSGGADISDFEDAPERLNTIRDLQKLIEAAPKPVIAAIEGLCLGGGLELAISTHFRLAQTETLLGFPEITLGLLPGSGGTQRAPRLLGAEAALNLMLTGEMIDAQAALNLGLVDQVVDDSVVDAAISAFKDGTITAPRRSGDLPVPADIESAIAAGSTSGKLSDAGQKILGCISILPELEFPEALAFEADAFAQLMSTDTSKSLRHGFFGRRTVSRIPGLKGVPARAIEKVTVVGGGLMGTGIATALLNAGMRVSVVEPDQSRWPQAEGTIAKSLARDVSKKRISQSTADQRFAALSLAGSIEDAAEADLFIEAVFEDIAVKQQVFEAMDKYARPDAILASNTSTLDLNQIADFTTRPEQVLGMHFFSPAHIMRLLEIVEGEKTSADTLATAVVFAKQIKKIGVVAGVCDGFIGNRIMEEYLRQVWFLLEEGALPQQVDRAVEAFGMAMGPCRVMDLAGQDIGWSIRKRRAIEQPDRPYSKVPDLICEMGRFGQKTGAGFYIYPDGRTPEVDPEIEPLIIAHSEEIGVERRDISDAEIVERCILAMVNEGARILEEGIAYRPVDIDIVYLEGYGFPASRGGPMFHAELLGLPDVLETLRKYQAGRHGWAWEPAPLIETLVAEGRSFKELNSQ